MSDGDADNQESESTMTSSTSTILVTDERVLSAVIEAYYPQIVGSGGTARSRAQAAQSAASVFVGAISGALAISSATQGPQLTRYLGCAAAIAWSVVAILYVFAVGTPPRDKAGEVHNGDVLVRTILERARGDRVQIDRWLLRANVAFMAALVLTLVTLSSYVFGDRPKVHVTASVTPAEAVSIRHQCGSSPVLIEGSMERSALDKDLLAIHVTRPTCGRAGNVLYVPRSEVVSLIVNGD